MDNIVTLFFNNISDPRIERQKLYPLEEILLISLLSVICGAQGYNEMRLFGLSKLEFLRSVMPFENGIPSDDTFRRVFQIIDSKQFHDAFLKWTRSLQQKIKGLVCIDGKTVRGSAEKGQGALHVVSAFASENSLVLGQVATDEKSNEITSIPELLDLLDIRGCVVSIDAMGCQKKIASKIRQKGGDYLLSLKGNQKYLHEDVAEFFEAHESVSSDFEEDDFEVDVWTQEEQSRNRLEKRKVVVTSDFCPLIQSYTKDWQDLRTVVMVERYRKVDDNESTTRHYYISSAPADAAKIAHAVRSHWGIENKLHWHLDVTLGEDQCRVRKDHGPENYNVLRHVAMNILKRNKQKKESLRGRIKRAGWDDQFLLNIIKN